ncbi:MAG: ribonucleotide reductase subunit alpha [Pseudomonadota bacterium]
MSIQNFDDLLQQSQLQSQPQRLLLVFANAELPDDATAAQRAGFLKGEGGALVPHMCVDKLPQEIASFKQLLDESAEHAPDWRMVFVAAMSGAHGAPPSSEAADPQLQRMVEMIRAGALASLLSFDRQGLAVQLG